MAEATITVTIRTIDAIACAMGPLDYSVAAMYDKRVPRGASLMRLREDLAKQLGITNVDSYTYKDPYE